MADTEQGFSFSIENATEMGNQQMINDFLSPDTATAAPEDVEKIEEAPKKKPVEKAPISPKKEEEKEEDKSIESFLGGEDDEEEEEKEEVKKPKPVIKKTIPDAEVAEEEESTEDNKFSALANDLFKLNVFTKGEDEDDVAISTPEEFLERFNYEKSKGVEEKITNFIGQFGQDYQDAFDAIYVNGVDPKEYFSTYNTITDFTNMDLSQESNQVAIVRQALTDQGFDKEDIESEIERFKNYGDLEAIATKHHKVLAKKEVAKLSQLQQESERKIQQQTQAKQQYINNVATVLQDKVKVKDFDGIPINPKLAGELQDYLTKDRYKTPSGETLTEFDRTILDLKRPENHEMKVKVALLLKILEKDPTLSTIQKTGVTKKTNTLFESVTKQVDKSTTKSKEPNKWFV